MTEQERSILKALLNLTTRQHELIKLIHGAASEMAECLMYEKTPTHEQTERWTRLNFQVSGDLIDISAAYEAVIQAAAPLRLLDS